MFLELEGDKGKDKKASVQTILPTRSFPENVAGTSDLPGLGQGETSSERGMTRNCFNNSPRRARSR